MIYIELSHSNSKTKLKYLMLSSITDFSSFGRAFDCSCFSLLSKGSWFDSSK